MTLEKYREKRHFAKTPEPAGERAEPPAVSADSGTGLRYAIQKHAARRLHYDFRLELDGVLLSWAVPKGPSLDPHDRRLASRVEDHPIEYGDFEGTIPAGEYGAGTVELWDRGSWQPEGDPHDGLERGDLKFTLHGEKLKGSWVLVRMKPRPGREKQEEWLLIKHRDEHAVDGNGDAILNRKPQSVASGRTLEEIAANKEASVWHGDLPADAQTDVRPGERFRLDPSTVEGSRKVLDLPRFVSPELATLVKRPPLGDKWLHEAKFDGYRILSRLEHGSVRLYSRNEQDWTHRYRTLADELVTLPVEAAMLDGEVVMQLPDGRHSFQALQGAGRAGAGETGGQLVYYVFDLLYLNGYDLLAAPIEARKELLRNLLTRVSAPHVLFSQHVTGEREGKDLHERACHLGLEGVVSKKAQTRYKPGARAGDWLKSKCLQGQEFVVGGFTEPAGSRVGFGALLLGANENGRLRYVGKVGTGFDARLLRNLGQRLHELETDAEPFEVASPRKDRGIHWVRPELVAEVAFSEWTREGLIRHPSFKGLREDKTPDEVRVEQIARSHENSEPNPERPVQVKLTHPDRVFWPHDGLTKRDLVEYYNAVAEWMLPYVVGRPIAMVRCPDGIEGAPATVRQGRGQTGPCFFHKHPGTDFPGPFERVTITESEGPATYLAITEPASLTALAQMGVLEIHIWGSTWPDIERPDMLVFDLDPDPAVSWRALADGARLVRSTLRAFGVESFVKTTGGKGLHVVAPISPAEGWQTVHDFCKAVTDRVVAQAPEKYTATMSKAKRTGKIFVDYVRNNRGSTSVAPYSTRARERATVSVPIRWEDLGGRIRPDSYSMKDLPARLRRLKGDPWEGYVQLRNEQSLTPAAKDAAGVSEASDRKRSNREK